MTENREAVTSRLTKAQRWAVWEAKRRDDRSVKADPRVERALLAKSITKIRQIGFGTDNQAYDTVLRDEDD